MDRKILMMYVAFALTMLGCTSSPAPQNVFLVVIDGARYSETLGAQDAYIPNIWNRLRPQGTVYTNFYNGGWTTTSPGFSSMLTGAWQYIANDGSECPHEPTVFEYFRKHTEAPESTCFVISGKEKLHILTHSDNREYGSSYRASFRTSASYDDLATWEQVLEVLDGQHPRLLIVGFPEVDIQGHDGDWDGYLRALSRVDSLVAVLWRKIQHDPFYEEKTTMFVTNDHGRHSDTARGFSNHGDSCEGCRHIMLLAVGPEFTPNAVDADTAYQVDIAPTVGAILGIPTPKVQGKSLLSRQPGL